MLLVVVISVVIVCSTTTVVVGNDICSTGKYQSPIAIEDHWVRRTMGRVNMYNYKTLATFENIGYANVTVIEPTNITISITTDNQTTETPTFVYKFDHIHFHPDCQEHSIDNERHLLETHFVHFNTKYRSLSEAKNKDDGLLVIAVLYTQLPEEGEIMMTRHEKCESLHIALESNERRSLNSLYDLLPVNWTQYYTYKGSLTTDNCEESVTWMVIKQHWYICAYQVETFKFFSLKRKSCRSKQKLNGRTVYLVTVKDFTDVKDVEDVKDDATALEGFKPIWIVAFSIIALIRWKN